MTPRTFRPWQVLPTSLGLFIGLPDEPSPLSRCDDKSLSKVMKVMIYDKEVMLVYNAHFNDWQFSRTSVARLSTYAKRFQKGRSEGEEQQWPTVLAYTPMLGSNPG